MAESVARDRGAVLAGLLAMLLFSGNFVSSRHGLEHGLAVAELLLLRYAVAGPLFALVLWRVGLGGLAPWRALLLAATGGAPYFLLTAAALHFAPATHASVLNPGGTVLFAPLLGWWLLREAPGTGVRLGLAVLLFGLALIGAGSVTAGGDRAWIGDLLLLGSGLVWALYGVLMRRWRVDGTRAAAIAGALSLAWVPPHLALLGTGGIAAAPGEALLQAGYQGLCAGGLAVLLYSRAIAQLGPARGALLPPLVPALGVFWAWLLLGEAVTATQVAGMALVVLGMLLGALWRGA